MFDGFLGFWRHLMKRVLVWLAAIIGFLMIAIPTSVYVASGFWMDDTYPHTSATSALPIFSRDSNTSSQPSLSIIRVGEFEFRARAAGFGGTEGNVVLLHGCCHNPTGANLSKDE